MKLAVEGFQIIANFVHRRIIPQISQPVKGVPGDLHRIGLVCFDLAQGIAALLFNKQRINGDDKETGLMQHIGYRFVVTSDVLHDHSGSPFNGFQLLYQVRKILSAMAHLKEHTDYFAKGRSTATVLFLLESSIPAMFMLNTHRKNLHQTEVIFFHCQFHLFADANAQVQSVQIEHSEREDG